MKLSVFGLVSLAVLFCTLQSTTADKPSLSDLCKKFDPLNIFCTHFRLPENKGDATTGNGTAAGNATDGSAGAPRSLPIVGSLGKLIPPL